MRDGQGSTPERKAKRNTAEGPPMLPNRRRVAELKTLFDDDGPLARHIPGYRPRESQLRMALAVAAAIEGSAPRAAARPSRAQLRLDAAEREGRVAAEMALTAGQVGDDASASESAQASGAAIADGLFPTPVGADGGNTLIVEAGTGTGKTYAYLVPAMLWGGKVIVSTGTKHLQDQLFLRDVPTVRDALAVPVTVAMLKGRSNYLCHYHLERAHDGARTMSRQDLSHLSEVSRFGKITRTGDKSELSSIPENAAIWPLVTSTRENCLGQECPNYKDCFVMQARREAQQADVVVVNHHLFFADILLRDSGMAELLPTANTVIFDEAHQLPETATLFFGETVSTGQLMELARDSVAEGLSHARDGADWRELANQLERATRDVRLAFGPQIQRLSLAQVEEDHPFHPALDDVEKTLDTLVGALSKQSERADTLAACLRRARELQDGIARWREGAYAAPADPDELIALADPSLAESGVGEADDSPRAAAQKRRDVGASGSSEAAADKATIDTPVGGEGSRSGRVQRKEIETVRWIEVFTHAVQLHQTPLSVAPIFSKQRAGVPRAWVFTSATLSVKNDFTHYAAQMGLSSERSMTLPSPFDYPNQGLLYVPRDMPPPSAPHFTDAVLDAAIPLIEASGGRCFLLCTTLRAVERMAMRLRTTIEARGWTYPLLVQGEASRTELLDRFRHYGNAILIGSQSFWEGVDVRGDALSLVVIDKLPFAPPDDPVLAARLDALTKKGLSPFAVHQLPQAVITLKQGAGRLIRAETDRGVLMIADTRLVEKPYGRRIWQSLPPFSRTREVETVTAFLREPRSEAGADAAE
jgi:ATP-dependent DNA helicase DinG